MRAGNRMSNAPETRRTRILCEAADRDPKAAAELLPLVYEELRALASDRMRRERNDHTLQPTALVHEAFQRLVGRDVSWQGRAHFFGAAADAMRDILIDHARAKGRDKRGGGAKKLPLDIVSADDLVTQDDPDTIILFDDLLRRMGSGEALTERVARLRLFNGMSVEETASALGISDSSVKRYWRYARAWLARELKSAD